MAFWFYGLEETMHRTIVQQKLTIGFLLAVSFLFLAATTAVAAADDYDTVLKNAGAKFSQGSYEEALKLYKKANGMRKNNFECLWQIARTQNKLGQYSDALKTADKVIKINSANPALQSMGWNLRGRTLFDAAIDDPQRLNKKSILKSESAIREALKISPNLNLAHYNLGVVLMRMDRTDEGLAELQIYLRNAEEPDIAEQARMIIHTPKIPAPDLELGKSVKADFPDGFRYEHTVRIKNADAFPADLFRATQFLPPCTLGASPMATGTRMEVTVMDGTPLIYPSNCRITSPERLKELTVVSQLIYRNAAARWPKPKSIYVRIKDRLIGSYVFSDSVELPKY
jgi:hypothetical protein